MGKQQRGGTILGLIIGLILGLGIALGVAVYVTKVPVPFLNKGEHRPCMFYFHPWEIDPDQPRIPGAGLKSNIRHYTNLGRMEGKLRRLLRDFAWDRVDRVYALDTESARV